MKKSIPPLTWFRAFESAARHLSFTKAAEELSLTQSAISQHVRALEEQFGCALFIRKHRGLALSDHGRRLLPSVSTAISTLASAAAAFETGASKKVLTVAASLSISRWYILPHLKSFTEQHRDIAIRLTSKTWPDEFSGLEADVEIRFDSSQSAGKNARLIEPNALQIVASPSLVKKKQSVAYAPEKIAQLPLIQVIGTADTWQEWARHNGITRPLDYVAFVESHGIAIDMARKGVGVAYTNGIIAAPSVKEKSLHILERIEAVPKEGYYLTKNSNDEDSASSLFSSWLDSIIKDYSAAR